MASLVISSSLTARSPRNAHQATALVPRSEFDGHNTPTYIPPAATRPSAISSLLAHTRRTNFRCLDMGPHRGTSEWCSRTS